MKIENGRALWCDRYNQRNRHGHCQTLNYFRLKNSSQLWLSILQRTRRLFYSFPPPPFNRNWMHHLCYSEEANWRGALKNLFCENFAAAFLSSPLKSDKLTAQSNWIGDMKTSEISIGCTSLLYLPLSLTYSHPFFLSVSLTCAVFLSFSTNYLFSFYSRFHSFLLQFSQS